MAVVLHPKNSYFGRFFSFPASPAKTAAPPPTAASEVPPPSHEPGLECGLELDLEIVELGEVEAEEDPSEAVGVAEIGDEDIGMGVEEVSDDGGGGMSLEVGVAKVVGVADEGVIP